MARINRVTQKIFAGAASNNGVFGSGQLGLNTVSNDLAVLQAGAAWPLGWNSAIEGASKFPILEEFQALNYINTTQLSYLFQQGIPEWDAGTTYYANSICTGAGNLKVYASLTNGNLNNAVTDATNWILLIDFTNTRTRLTANTAYYVATTGNDANPGTAALPWLTIQKAINYVYQNIDTAGYSITINVADGTYTGAVSINGALVGNGVLSLTGNIVTPTNCVISVTNNACISVTGGASLILGGFKLTSITNGNLLICQSAATVNVSGLMNYGPVAGANNAQIIAQSGGLVTINANYTISGGGAAHFNANALSEILVNCPTVTLSGTPAFTNFALASFGLIVVIAGTTAFSGAATGSRYSVQLNGVIQTQGGGATYLPGNAAGSLLTGGQYV